MKIFFKRICAFLIDCVILYLAITLIGSFVPVSSNLNNLNNQTIELMNKYLNAEVSEDKFIEETNNLNYEISKATYLNSIVGIVIYILYFIVYQSYNNGQTLGKKWMKIQVLKQDDSKVDVNSLLFRALIPYGIFVNILCLILLISLNKSTYMPLSVWLNNIHLIVIGVTIIMMSVKGRGLHDVLAKTKVKELS